MWNYAELSQLAKALGGPEMLVKTLTKRGIELGIKQAKDKYGLMVGLGFLGGSILTGVTFLVVNHFKKGRPSVLDSGDAAEQLLIDGINAYDEEAKENPDLETLPEISREEAEARIDQYVQEVADELKNDKSKVQTNQNDDGDSNDTSAVRNV